MSLFSTLRRTVASATRVQRAPIYHTQAALSKARLTVLPTRRFASNKPSSKAPNGSSNGAADQPAQKVTKAMIIHEGREILKLLVGGVVIVSGLVASSGFVIEGMKRVNPKPAPGRFVQIKDDEGNAVQVHVQRLGSGDVTVIFDGGVGETSFDWDKVAQQVGQFASVLSIDRPGLGFSTKAETPRTAMQIAKEYAQVLGTLNIRGNVVLVAHGAGGYNMRQLAENLEDDGASPVKCQGLVLVDALQENLRADLESVSEPVQKALQAMDANGNTVLMLSYIGLVRLITNIQHKKNEAKYSPEALPFIEFFTPTPAHRATANDENSALPLTEQRFRDAPPPPQGFAFPCVVLSHGRADLFESMKVQPGVDLRAVAMLEHKWQNAQRTLAKSVGATPATQIVVKDAGHCIHHEKPEEITKIVRALVNEAHEKGAATGLAAIQEGTCPV